MSEVPLYLLPRAACAIPSLASGAASPTPPRCAMDRWRLHPRTLRNRPGVLRLSLLVALPAARESTAAIVTACARAVSAAGIGIVDVLRTVELDRGKGELVRVCERKHVPKKKRKTAEA